MRPVARLAFIILALLGGLACALQALSLPARDGTEAQRDEAQREAEVVAEYNACAATYDERWADYISATLNATLLRALPALAGEACGADCRVIDVGCGTGAMAAALHTRFPRWRIVCVDPCEFMLAAARRRHPWLRTQQAVAERLPFADGSFDIAVSLSSLHFWTNRPAGLREVRRVLRPNSLLVATDWAADFWAVRALAGWLRANGFPKQDADVLSLARARELLADAKLRVTLAETYQLPVPIKVTPRTRAAGTAQGGLLSSAQLQRRMPSSLLSGFGALGEPRWGMFTLVARTPA
jgi:ubiquinone/menaquinone biosynthesis C-methylase UbiE